MNADKLKALVKLIQLMKARTSKKTKTALDKNKKSAFLDKLKGKSEKKTAAPSKSKDSSEKMPVFSNKPTEVSEKVYEQGAEMSGMAGYLPEMDDDINMKLQRKKIKEQKPYDRIEKKEK